MRESGAIKRRTLLATLAGALCATRRTAFAQTLATVRVGMALTDGITPVLYGIQSGLFKEAGLDVQLTVGNSGAANAAAVAGGALDVAASSLMPLLTAHGHGVPLRIIAGSTIFNPAAPTGELCVRKTSRITSFADLNGATIAVTALRGLDQLGMLSLVDKNGGNSATLKFVETPGSLMLGLIEHGIADGGSFSEPTLTVALSSGEIRTIGDPDAGIDPRGLMIAAFFATPAYAAQNRGLVDRFTQALYRATRYANTHHAKTVPLLADYTRRDPDLIRKTTRETIATSLDPRMIQPAIDVAAKYKFIDAWFDAKELLA
jgi:NitT/TauT family transport system substrate-binding protein